MVTLMQSLKKTLPAGFNGPAESGFDPDPSLVPHQRSSTDGPKQPIVILRMKQLQARIGIRRSAVYYKLDKNSPHHDPSFPCPVKISARCVGFIEQEVNDWLESRVHAARSPTQNLGK